MKLIFLDIDGVMSHEIWCSSEKPNIGYDKLPYFLKFENLYRTAFRYLADDSMKNLNIIIEKTGANVVISSSHRVSYTIEELQRMFDIRGFKGKIVGKTPSLFFMGLKGYTKSVPRGNEIKAWMETNKNLINEKMSKIDYVILDDDSDMLYWQRNNFIKINPYCGLNFKDTIQAIDILNKIK